MTARQLAPGEWKVTPLSLVQWKADCRKSSMRKDANLMRFVVDDRRGVVQSVTHPSQFVTLYIGFYFLDGRPKDGVLAGTGWSHK